MAKEANEVASELRSIKMLLIMQLMQQGVKQSQIAAMLGISEATMSRMIPKGAGQKVRKKSDIPMMGERADAGQA
jgi:predicted transcriptional regulator